MTAKWSCKLGIREPRHCRERQLNQYRRTKAGNLNIIFVSCKGCKNWLSDEEYAAAQETIERFKKPWEARLG